MVYGAFVQTFLPYPDYRESARVLDRQRLGKQRVEGWQILQTLKGLTDKRGWANHPAVKMWAGHERSLAVYCSEMCVQWISRGYKDTLLPRFTLHLLGGIAVPPEWLGDPAFHASHRSNLLRKAPDHYRTFWPHEPDDLPYLWPTSPEQS